MAREPIRFMRWLLDVVDTFNDISTCRGPDCRAKIILEKSRKESRQWHGKLPLHIERYYFTVLLLIHELPQRDEIFQHKNELVH